METYFIYSDLHIGHPYEIITEFIFTKNTVFLGDNFDIKNALKSEVSKTIEKRNNTIKKIKEVGGIYVAGNHSLKNLEDCVTLRNKILFLHGDIIGYGEERAKKFRSKGNPGKSWLYRLWLDIIMNKLGINSTPWIRNKWIKKAVEMAKVYKCNTVCMGHFHPKKLFDKKINKIRIVVLPRGKTEIKL